MPKDKAKDKDKTKVEAKVIQPVKRDLAQNFLLRLLGKQLPDNHYLDHDVPVTAPVRKRKKRVKLKDPVATVAADPDSKAVKLDVDQAMGKIKDTLATISAMQHNNQLKPGYDPEDYAYPETAQEESVRKITAGLQKKGRDKIAYAALARNGNMDHLLEKWDPSWPVEKSVGLLIDISLEVRHERYRTGDIKNPDRGDLISEHLQDSRLDEQHAVNKDSAWYKDLPENTETHAGVSATTANLLLLLEDMDVPLPQVEALMNGVVKYWDGLTRKASGHYHTAAEVWAAYNEHLEKRLQHQWAVNKWQLNNRLAEEAARANEAGESSEPSRAQRAARAEAAELAAQEAAEAAAEARREQAEQARVAHAWMVRQSTADAAAGAPAGRPALGSHRGGGV